MITAAQMRAGRALLGIDQQTLADLAGVSLPTIQRMEASEGNVRGVVDTLTKVVTAFDRAGVELIAEGRTQHRRMAAACVSSPAVTYQSPRLDRRTLATAPRGEEAIVRASIRLPRRRPPTTRPTIPPLLDQGDGHMDTSARSPLRRPQPSFTELFTPKLVTSCATATRGADLRADAIAGLTVAIVALPLSMAIAIGSGLSPDKGLFTAIVGGFLISALGGSRFQIGGPAGAFIVLIASIVERHGYDGLVLATAHGRRDDDGRRVPAAWHLHQVHSVPGHRGLHRRHRRHHSGEPAEGAARPRYGERAGGTAAQAASHLGERRHRQARDCRALARSRSPSSSAFVACVPSGPVCSSPWRRRR